MKSNPVYYNQCICLQNKITKKLLEEIKKISHDMIKNKSQLKDFRNVLAGNIENEYCFYEHKDLLEPLVFNLADEYNRARGHTKKVNWKLMDIWINFQKKYEFNPLHNHSGDLSFVLWVQIPYDLKEELNLDNTKKSNSTSNSLFEFVHSDYSGNYTRTRLPIDKDWEGTLIIFPSGLHHAVYPFYTSDDYRISISGNLRSSENNFIETQKNKNNFALSYK